MDGKDLNTTFSTDNNMFADDKINLSNSGASNLEHESPPPNFVTDRNRNRSNVQYAYPLQATELLHEDTGSPLSTYSKDFQVFQNNMMDILDKWCSKQDQMISKISQDFEELKKSVIFVNDKYDELSQKIYNNQVSIQHLDTKVNSLEKNGAQNKSLEMKIESLEQQLRQHNLEIGNIPDRRGENLIELLGNIGTAIKQSITQNDISAVHRVPHANTSSTHPKNIIVKFYSRIKRDNVLAAFRLAKGVSTDQLGVSGDPRKVYLNEHLTLTNKKLFREARSAAKVHGYRYVWVKHGTILVRENDASSVLAIRSDEDIRKIGRKTTPGNQNTLHHT